MTAPATGSRSDAREEVRAAETPDTASLREDVAAAVLRAAATTGERLGDDPRAHLEVLAVTVAAAQETSRLLHDAVAGARHAGNSWDVIGGVLGVSRQAAQQRFGAARSGDDGLDEDGHGDGPRRKVLEPVTAFDEMAALAEAARYGWHSVGFGMLHHVLESSAWQWEHRRVLANPLTHRRLTEEGWERIGRLWFPWAYYARRTDVPALRDDVA